jgi:hypothetical protein
LRQNQNRSHEAVEGDGGGCQVLSIQRCPTCSTPLQNPMTVEEHQRIPFPIQISTTISFILTRLIQIWTKTTHFFISSSQSHNYIIDPTTHFQGDPMSMILLIFFYQLL